MTRVPALFPFVTLAVLVFADRSVLSHSPRVVALTAAERAATTPASVVLNDNLEPAGDLRDGVLTLGLRAGAGMWRPEGPSGRALRINQQS